MNRNDDYDEITQQGEAEYDSSQRDMGGGMGRQQGLQGQDFQGGDDSSGGRQGMRQSKFPGGSDDSSYDQRGDTMNTGDTGDSWNQDQRMPQSQQQGGLGGDDDSGFGRQNRDQERGGRDFVGQYEEDDSSRRQGQKSGLLRGQEPSGRQDEGFQSENYQDDPSRQEGYTGSSMGSENVARGGGQEFGGFQE